MNHKIKRKWCAALRGGTWTQIKGQYHDAEQGRCALGVLRDVLSNNVSDHIEGPARLKIAKMNDLDGKSFGEIADWIEGNL
jgi:hypothetical protein